VKDKNLSNSNNNNIVMKKELFYIKVILILMSFFSCKRKDTNYNSIVNDWKIDSIGCNGLRNPNLANKLIGENKLEGKNVNDFEIIFGKPNEIRESFLEKTYVYYYSSFCKDGKLVKNSDKCYAEFYFINSNFESVGFICE
jgi:hypothetical protein